MGLGLMATEVVNILFGLSSSLWMFALLWVANAFFQGWAGPCSKLLTSWYSRTERGFWWSAWNTAHNVGGAPDPLIVSTLALQHGWRYGMVVPGLIAILIGLVLCWNCEIRRAPWAADGGRVAPGCPGDGPADPGRWSLHRQILRKYVLGNPYIWLLACCYVLVYVVRTAINDWAIST